MNSNIDPNATNSVSQTRAILAYMREGNTINPKIARERFGSDRLGARIKDIEKILGFAPPRRFIEVQGIDPYGNPKTKRVMSYWLPEEECN